MKNKKPVITIFCSVLAGTLIFLGVFFALKPEKEKDEPLNRELEIEFEKSKKKILNFNVNLFDDCDFTIFFEKRQYKKQYLKLKEDYQKIKNQFNQYQKINQSQKDLIKNLIQDANQFIESFNNFIVNYDYEYQKFLEKKTIYLFKNLEELAIDFFSFQAQTSFQQKIIEIKNNFHRVFNQNKYNLNEKIRKEYQNQYQNEISVLVNYFNRQEREFKKQFNQIKNELTILKNQIKSDLNYVNQFNLTVFFTQTEQEQIQKMNQDYSDFEKTNCDSKETRFEQKECLTEKIPNYQDLNKLIANLKKHLNQIEKENEFNVTLTKINNNFDNLNKIYDSNFEIKKLLAIIQKEIREIKNIKCDYDFNCWQDKINKTETLKVSDETINEFISNINNIKNNQDNQELYHLVTKLESVSFFNNSEITKQLKAGYDDNFEFLKAFKYQSWVPSNYQSLKGTQLFTNDNYDYLQIINETNNYVNYQKKLGNFVNSILINGKPNYSYFNWFQIMSGFIFDVFKVYLTIYYIPNFFFLILNRNSKVFKIFQYFNLVTLLTSNVYYLLFNFDHYFNDLYFNEIKYRDILKDFDFDKLSSKLFESYAINTLFLFQKVKYAKLPNNAFKLEELEVKRIISNGIYFRTQFIQLFDNFIIGLIPVIVAIFETKKVLILAKPYISKKIENVFKYDFDVVFDFDLGFSNSNRFFFRKEQHLLVPIKNAEIESKSCER